MDGGVNFSAMFSNLKAGGSGKAQEVSAGFRSLDTELKKILIDERMRCAKHKTNYQTLKAEYIRLKGKYTQSQAELRRMLSKKQVSQEKLQLLLAGLRGEVLDMTQELDELRLQVITPQRLKLLKAQLQQEMEVPIKERFNKLEEEAEKYRSKYNKLCYDFTFLKSMFDHQQEDHERVLKEQQIRYSADLALVKKEKEKLSAQLQSGDCVTDGKRVEALLREKAQMHQRLCSLEAEVAEIRAERDSTRAQAENTQRIQLRQLAESQTALKTLESEKQSVCLQLDRVEKELRSSHEQHVVLTGKLHKAEREIHTLNSQVEENKHAYRLKLANVLKARGELERERDKLQTLGEESALKELQNINAKLQQQTQQLEELERQKAENTELRRHNAELNVQVSTLSNSKLELMDTNARLRESLERVREELRNTRTQTERIQRETGRLEKERRVEWLEEKHTFQKREAELQEKYSQAKQRMQKAALAQKKIKTLTETKEKKLRDKLQLLEAKIEELEFESSVAKKNPLFAEEHAQLCRHLSELQRRHKEFRQLLMGNHMLSMSVPNSIH
ncbi:centrosomal protein of 83 kDa isoform X2 [Silurus asotus]|uniref:Centrosomal protein of 83 kDa isoform X2 n=1 Tax=Silurus asotus TaxID=30991 RepID=A0AAD5FAI0_SILAS|nr:centrosomal protein of 83 kDa isoform X2 [Silurus asotus]